MIDLKGTLRACSPEETLSKIIQSNIMNHIGLTRIADITHLDSIGLHTFVAIRPNSKSLTTSQGKGVSRNLAKVSAIMESIELWHAENLSSPELIGSYDDLNKFFNLRQCSYLEDSQWIRSVDLDNVEIPWIIGRDVETLEPVYVPWTICSMDFRRRPPDPALLSCTSNGLASGNTHDEAVCHALFEVIEREAEAKFYNRMQAPRLVNLGSITSFHLNYILQSIKNANLEIKVYDITDTKELFPTYISILHDPDTSSRNVRDFRGSGTHLSPEIALSRALTEAIQSRATLISGSRDDMFPSLYMEETPKKSRNAIQTSEGCVAFRELDTLPSTFNQMKKEILRRLHNLGYKEVYEVDLSKTDIGIDVVKVIVNGCRINQECHSNRSTKPSL